MNKVWILSQKLRVPLLTFFFRPFHQIFGNNGPFILFIFEFFVQLQQSDVFFVTPKFMNFLLRFDPLRDFYSFNIIINLLI